jgi:hypothetical protein
MCVLTSQYCHIIAIAAVAQVLPQVLSETQRFNVYASCCTAVVLLLRAGVLCLSVRIIIAC